MRVGVSVGGQSSEESKKSVLKICSWNKMYPKKKGGDGIR